MLLSNFFRWIKLIIIISKDLYIEISAHFGIESVENLIADRRNRFITRYGEIDNYLCQMLRWLVQFVWLYFFIYCVCLFPFAKFFSFFHLCCATTYVGEIKLYDSDFRGREGKCPGCKYSTITFIHVASICPVVLPTSDGTPWWHTMTTLCVDAVLAFTDERLVLPRSVVSGRSINREKLATKLGSSPHPRQKPTKTTKSSRRNVYRYFTAM